MHCIKNPILIHSIRIGGPHYGYFFESKSHYFAREALYHIPGTFSLSHKNDHPTQHDNCKVLYGSTHLFNVCSYTYE